MQNQRIKDFNKLIEELIHVWGSWMNNHYVSNDSSLSFSDRRKGGEACEKLQEKRQKLLIQIDEIFNELCESK
tara:strand:+ start:3150 stop:3368 length:219 start_codon:yes stop_codon:yes gene_type:complete